MIPVNQEDKTGPAAADGVDTERAEVERVEIVFIPTIEKKDGGNQRSHQEYRSITQDDIEMQNIKNVSLDRTFSCVVYNQNRHPTSRT